MSFPKDPKPPDPGDHFGDDLPANDRTAIVDALLKECAEWLRGRCRQAATDHALDPDDVFQQTLERLLRSSVAVELDHRGLKTWLGKLVDWTTVDLMRQRRREGGERLPADEVEALLADADVRACSSEDDEGGLDAAFLGRFGLTPHQVGVLLEECSGVGLTLREYARLVGRSHAAVRKDQERARRLIERFIGLTVEERRVFVASRATGRWRRPPSVWDVRPRSSATCSTPH